MARGTTYPVKTIPLTTLLVGDGDIIKPLCNSCTNLDCGNPIEKKLVSAVNRLETWKIYKTARGVPGAVVNCEGYQP